MSNTPKAKMSKNARGHAETNRDPFEFRLADFCGRTDLIDPDKPIDRQFDETFLAERVAELAEDDVDADELHSVRSFARLRADTVRQIGGMDDTQAMFVVIDTLDDDLRDDLMKLEAEEIGRFFAEWQLAAGVTLPE